LKVYLAAQFKQINEMRKYAEELRAEGIEVVSRWLEEKVSPNISLKEMTPDECKRTAEVDLEDIQNADVFVLFTVDPDEPTKRGGRHFESGVAFALGKPTIFVGPYENIFHYFGSSRQRDEFAGAKRLLIALKELHAEPLAAADKLTRGATGPQRVERQAAGV
jgi:nucleoside 2-deoxyribosyltransferase